MFHAFRDHGNFDFGHVHLKEKRIRLDDVNFQVLSCFILTIEVVTHYNRA